MGSGRGAGLLELGVARVWGALGVSLKGASVITAHTRLSVGRWGARLYPRPSLSPLRPHALYSFSTGRAGERVCVL